MIKHAVFLISAAAVALPMAAVAGPVQNFAEADTTISVFQTAAFGVYYFTDNKSSTGLTAAVVTDFQTGNDAGGIDGTTPESHGYTVSFASGMPSPNIAAVPEPSSFVLRVGSLLALGCGRFVSPKRRGG
jgi:hypothetical protein